MNVSKLTKWSIRALILAVCLPAVGCAVFRPSSDASTRTGVRPGYFNLSRTSAQTVLLMGEFENPAHSPLHWRDVGSGMTVALSRELRSEGQLDVWVNHGIGREVKSILEDAPSRRADRFQKISDGNPDVRYILIGRVTDFLHEGEPTSQTARRWYNREAPKPTSGEKTPPPRATALVAIDFSVIDIEQQRAVLSDHILGRAKAGPELARDVYRDLSFGSYRFWSTPLGQASLQALDQVRYRLRELPLTNRVLANPETPQQVVLETDPSTPTEDPAPPPIETPVAAANQPAFTPREGIRIQEQIHPRRVRLTTTHVWTLQEGQIFYVSTFDPRTGRMVAVYDRDTGRPLRARIVSADRTSGIAYLMGLKPLELDLRGAQLTRRIEPAAASLDASHETMPTMAGAESAPMHEK